MHGPAQVAQAVLACRAAGLRPVLVSARAAGCHGGGLWWRELVAQGCTQAGTDPAHCIAWLDCADAPGWAMAALRAGCRHLVLAPCPARAAVQGAATTLGARLRVARPAALDLGLPHALRALPAHLGHIAPP